MVVAEDYVWDNLIKVSRSTSYQPCGECVCEKSWKGSFSEGTDRSSTTCILAMLGSINL